jgi:large subunit ribosomal protein L31
MKDNIHPKYFKTKASCACGAVYDIGSTKEDLKVDICSKCHPLFTGTEKLIDSEGRVEKFKKKFEKAAETEGRLAQLAGKQKREREEKETAKLREKEKLAALRQKLVRIPDKKEEPALTVPASAPVQAELIEIPAQEASKSPVVEAKKTLKPAAPKAKKAAAKPAKKAPAAKAKKAVAKKPAANKSAKKRSK